MTTDQLQASTISPEALHWLQEKYRAVDSRDGAAYARFLAEDCVLRFGNNPPAEGRAAVLQGLKIFWKSIGGLNHRFVQVLGTDDRLMLEADIEYTRADGRTVAVPAATVIERNARGEAAGVRIFADLAPVFA